MLTFNTAFNPQNKDPLVKYVENRYMLRFSSTLGSELTLRIGKYEIVTDVGLTPFVSEEVLTGTYIAGVSEVSFIRTSNYFLGEIIASVYITFDPEYTLIERQYGKIDDALSYVGGLFGLVIAFLAFFMMSYNEYRYELFASESLGFRDKSVKEKDFHFLLYLKYVLYDWVKILFCCEPDWEFPRKIDAVREETNEQLDVQMLLRRISHLE